MGTAKYIPTQDRGRTLSGPTTAMAVIGVSASVAACVGITLSAALHMFAGFSRAPMLAAAVADDPAASHKAAKIVSVPLIALNFLLPISIVAATLLIFRSWRKREQHDSE